MGMKKIMNKKTLWGLAITLLVVNINAVDAQIEAQFSEARAELAAVKKEVAKLQKIGTENSKKINELFAKGHEQKPPVSSGPMLGNQ